MAALTLTLNLDAEIGTMSEEELTLVLRRQGFDSVTEALENLYEFFKTSPIQSQMHLAASSVTDENGKARRNYSGMVLARWEDEDGALVLGMGNGDSITVTLPK